MICKRCGAPLKYEDGNNILKCPNCGATQIIDESDAVKIEKLHMKAKLEEDRINEERKRLRLKQPIIVDVVI